jgi:hypothetical protein
MVSTRTFGLFCVALIALMSVETMAMDIYSMGIHKPVTPKAPGLDLCPLCVQFFNESIQELIDVIANVGIVGSCGALCGYLPSKTLDSVCDLLCSIVGIDEFIKLINIADPDPVYYCQALKVCPIDDNAAATINSVTSNPASGPQGTTFEIDMVFTVINQTGPGFIEISVNPPDAEPFGDAQFTMGIAPGQYGAKFNLQAQPSEQEPFNPGQYQVLLAICNGQCGSPHPHSKVLAEGQTNFTITGQ